MDDHTPEALRARLRAALPAAMKARDAAAVAALRSALAAIDNAEAVAVEPAPPVSIGDGEIAMAAVGLGAGDVARRTLTSAQIAEIVRGEVAERRSAAGDFERSGRSDRARRLHAEADVLAAHLAAHA